MRVSGERAMQIDFTELELPSIITDGFGGSLPSHGSVWVEPHTGTVLRTEVRLGGDKAPTLTETVITVEFRRDGRIQAFLPSEMRETYYLDIETLNGRASYRNYRRFQTNARLVVPGN
jgi:hypothetical protein